ncbi:MAG: Flp family type IVb pilin [Deltaproteobacteria bacterium]|nr:Flp family type IVb pilin [Deltaproteobacteria bacterium]
MKQFIIKSFALLRAGKGTGAVEYSLLIAGIALALLLVINSLGQQISHLADLIQGQ